MGMIAMYGNLIFWALLALAILLAVLGMFQFARPHYNVEGKNTSRRFVGFMTLLSGLLLGAFGMFAWIPQMANFGLLQSKFTGFQGREVKLLSENTRLSDLVKNSGGNVRKLKLDNKGLATKVKNKNALIVELRDGVKKQADANKRLKKRLNDSNNNQSEITRLRGVVARLNEAKVKLGAQNTRLKGLISAGEADDDEVKRLKGVIARLNENKTTMKDENTRLKGLLSSNRTDNAEVKRLKGVIIRLNENKTATKDENTRLKGLLSASRTDNDEIKRLKGVIARLNENKTAMKDENTRLKGLLSSSRTDNAEVKRLKGVIIRLNENKTTMKDENTRLKGLLSNNRTNSDEIARLKGVIARLNKNSSNINIENTRIKGLLGAFRNDSEVQRAEIASLKAALAKRRNKPVVTREIKTQRRSSPLSLINRHNQNNANLRLATKDYRITKLRRTNLVRGKSGHYYNVLIRNAANGKGYNFASASYSRVVPAAAFKASLARAISDIKKSLDGRRKYQFYVRGKASAGRYTGNPTPGFEYRDMKVLQQFRGKYDNEPEAYTYGPQVTNDNLPNLRGAYLQQFIAKNYSVGKPTILDGKVSSSNDPKEQAVALILYVED